jgi:hypothetical protein
MQTPSGNITKALQVLAKFEELVHAGFVSIDIEGKQVIVNPNVLPKNAAEKKFWMKEAFLYFKFKAVGEFDEHKEMLTITSSTDGSLIDRCTMDELHKVPDPVGNY